MMQVTNFVEKGVPLFIGTVSELLIIVLVQLMNYAKYPFNPGERNQIGMKCYHQVRLVFSYNS